MRAALKRDHDRDQLVARRAGTRGTGIRRALQRQQPAHTATPRGSAGTRWLAGWSHPATLRPDPSLAGRRAAAFGPAIDPLFYAELSRGRARRGRLDHRHGGRRYLDAYNNVPCVGHAHPRVSTAIARQSRLINTHTRYLHPGVIELAERLAATCPPELDTVLLVNSGSEANEVTAPPVLTRLIRPRSAESMRTAFVSSPRKRAWVCAVRGDVAATVDDFSIDSAGKIELLGGLSAQGDAMITWRRGCWRVRRGDARGCVGEWRRRSHDRCWRRRRDAVGRLSNAAIRFLFRVAR